MGKPNLLGQFSIWSFPNKGSDRFVVFRDSEGDETLVASCDTPKQAQKYCEQLNEALKQTNSPSKKR